MFQWLKNLFTSNKKSKPAKLWESGSGPNMAIYGDLQQHTADVRSTNKSYATRYKSRPSAYNGNSTKQSYEVDTDPFELLWAVEPSGSLYGYDVGRDSCTMTTAKYDETNDCVVVQDSSTHRYESSCTPSYDSPSYSSSSYDSGSSSSYSSCDSSSSSSSSSSSDW